MLTVDGIVTLTDSLQPTVSLMELAAGQCKWPYDDLMCCGRAQAHHKSYCPEHQARVCRVVGGYKPDLTTIAQMNTISGRKRKPLAAALLLPKLKLEDIG